MESLITCRELRHSYGGREVLHGIDFEVGRGGMVGLLGRNGAGKSTVINILMGFLRPDSGRCSVLGHPSHAIPPAARSRIGLLQEGFIQYDFMTIAEIERYYAPFYPRWDRSLYFDLVDRLADVPRTRRISRLSCGQRSQVTLGLILAQRAELLILDDYSLGLDVGYRRLFLEFLRDFVDKNAVTVLLTSHIVRELEDVLDEIVILQEGRVAARGKKDEFMGTFYQYRLPLPAADLLPPGGEGPLVRMERGKNGLSLFSHSPPAEMRAWLSALGLPPEDTAGLEPVPMNFEDAFVGLTGRY